jgi:nitrogen regulatory protein PII-like uncharacterized protein
MHKEKGSVYFIKHKGLTPIKIGYSKNEDPSSRLASISTDSPYGIQILGVITTIDPIELEKKLHKKYAEKRLNGEWFSIATADVDIEVEIHSDDCDIEMRHNLNCHYIEHMSRIATDRYYEKPDVSVYDKIAQTLLERSYSPVDFKDGCEMEYISAKDIGDEIQAFGRLQASELEMERALINLGYTQTRDESGISYLMFRSTNK